MTTRLENTGKIAQEAGTEATPALQALIARTVKALANGAGTEAMEALERAVADAVRDKDLLTPAQKEGGDGSYRRHVLHVDKTLPFTILSLVWRRGQASPIHGHRAWCAVGIVEGCLRVETYKCDGHGALGKDGNFDCGPGATCIELPDEGDIHRLSNCGPETAVSIHIYGFDLSADPTQINEVFEPAIWQGGCI